MTNRLAAALALATAIAIPAEGLRQYAYRDPAGILTVCYGTTGSEVVVGKHYGLSECIGFLNEDMRHALETVESCHPGLPEQVLAAFADAVYNIGPAVACDSTASRHLAAGNLVAACEQLPRWNKARIAGAYVALPGLTNRRAKERELCLQGVA